MKKFPIIEVILVILGSLLYFLANLQRVAVPGAIFTVLENDLKTSAQSITALGASFMYVYAFSQLVIGFRVVSMGAILFFAGSLLFPFSNSLYLLYFSRILIGIGSSSFYLSMIDETRKIVSKKNFGVVLSFVLLIGYLGSIVANAPLVVCVNKMGWRETFILTGIITAFIAILFLVISRFAHKQEIDKSVKLNLSLFKEVFANKKNIHFYIFSCINYGLYYVIQTVIGKKFLEDFCSMPVMKAATVLSVMGLIYALSGSIIAFISKAALNRRTIFLKIAATNTLFSFSLILICIFFNIRTAIIPSLLFCSISFWASLSPILVPLLHDINGEKIAGTAVSVMTCGFSVTVGLLGNLVGFCLDLFKMHPSLDIPAFNGNGDYVGIFILAAIFSVVAFVNVFRIEESSKTKKLLDRIRQITKEHHDTHEAHWHDKYEHHIYNNM
jgi:MFS family permease